VHRRVALLSMLALTFAVSTASAQGYPEKVVRIIVPYPAGGPVDVLGRALGQKLTEVWKQPVIVENRSGANEVIGAQAVFTAKPDGYTLLLGTDPSFSQNQFLYDKLPYDPVNGVVPIMRVANAYMTFAVPAGLPVNTLAEFVSLAKKEPGKLNYGSGGIGNVTHLTMAWFASRNGLEMNHVPYKGMAQTVQDLLAGQVQAAFLTVAVTEPHIKSHKLKVLAISGPKRARRLPDVPTFTEAGLEDVDASFYMALGAPAGLRDAIRDKIADDVKRVLADPEFREKYIENIALEIVGDTPAEFAAFLIEDRKKQEQRIKQSGAKLE
jgi:tripartite-type tricarboxylate transporter receptor subunit TctC